MNPWRVPPTLVGRHTTLRPLVPADRGAILAAFEDAPPSFTTLIPGPANIDVWFDRLDREAAAGRVIAFTVLDREGEVAGVTRFMRISEAHRRVEIGGTVYARRARRTGINTEAKRLLLGHAFDTLGCLCVQLRADRLNRESRAAIERLGAQMDGVLRSHLILGEHRRDTVVYSILEHEWPAVRRNIDALLARHGERR